jgi:ppGpp synthetase/RelA/SpoT-type nucleotidyltranferase
MTRRQTQKLLERFDQESPRYQFWVKKLELLVKEILDSNGLTVHSVSGRPKERKSLEKKIESKGRNHYKSLEDITDLAGVRVITYFSDDVDRVARLISEEFQVDEEASIDKRSQLDPEAFGYMSLHYIVSVHPKRSHLPEYKRLAGLKAEIQIRSVLQHAWAEIEHDLGYKTQGEIPRALRRRFSRLASLLELGDDEFITIRDQLSKYEKSVSLEIINSPQSVELDKLSLKSFHETDLLKQLDLDVARATNTKIAPKGSDQDYQEAIEMSSEWSLKRLKFLGIESIGELEERLKDEAAKIPVFASIWLSVLDRQQHADEDDEADEAPTFPPGICLFYLVLLSVAQTRDKEKICHYWKEIADKTDDRSEEMADLMAAALDKLECSFSGQCLGS